MIDQKGIPSFDGVPFVEIGSNLGVNYMNYKDHTERKYFACPRLNNGVARLKFVTRSFHANELVEPVAQSLIEQDCSGRLQCGITPPLGTAAFGMTDWEHCEFLILHNKGSS